jgi:hypothetical protein
MRIPSQSHWKILCYFIVAGCFLAGGPSANASAEEMADGLAFVTSMQGAVSIETADEHAIDLKFHDTLLLNNSTLRTGKDAHLFLALSNGMAIGLEENSELRVETFAQKPFTERKESLTHEPSTSTLSIQLNSGKLAIVSNNLSPLSQARVTLANGELRIHAATCVIQSDTLLGEHITACQGNLTYYYPISKKREFIANSQSVRISPQSAKLGKTTENVSLDTLPEHIDRFAQATQHASKRVFFKAGSDGQLPEPILIAEPTYFDQSAQRPYEFNE